MRMPQLCKNKVFPPYFDVAGSKSLRGYGRFAQSKLLHIFFENPSFRQKKSFVM
jgi:hypothetical protein